MTEPKTAILWGCNDLLAHSMEVFIKAEEKWEVVKISTDMGTGYLLDQAEKIHPDVIILYEQSSAKTANLLMELIGKQPNLRVVTVSLQDNQVQVYCKRSIVVRQVSDLLSIIEDRHFSNYPVEKEEEVSSDEINH
jgi:DNA-binding NarL/FixJ family response regulator